MTINDSLQRVRTVIEHLVKEGKIISRLDGSENEIFPVAMNSAEGEALRDWIVKEKPVHTIEIGLAYGISALFICEGLLKTGIQNVKHVALDPYQTRAFKDCGLQVLEDAGVRDMVEHCAEESQIALPRFVSEGKQFDFVFIDGSHLFDRVFLDLIYLGRLVKPGGIIFADDYQASAIKRAVSFCVKNLGWTLEESSSSDEHHQWVVLRTAYEPLQRSYPHFVEF